MAESAGASPAIRELGSCAKVRVVTWGSEFLPGTVAALSSLAGVVALRTGPSDWLLVSETAHGVAVNGDAILRVARDALAGDASVRAVDVSQALAAIEIIGVRARELLEKACAVDLHPRAFAVGSSTRTRFANVAAIVLRAGDEEFRCYVARSHRDYVLSWLNDAAAEWPGA